MPTTNQPWCAVIGCFPLTPCVTTTGNQYITVSSAKPTAWVAGQLKMVYEKIKCPRKADSLNLTGPSRLLLKIEEDSPFMGQKT